MAENNEMTNKQGNEHTGEYKEFLKEYSDKYPHNAGRLKELLEQTELLKSELTAKKATDEEIDFAVFDLMIDKLKINPEIKKELPLASPEISKRFSAGVLFVYAQVYYKIIETVSSAPASYADLLLNQYYLRVVKKIKHLLSLDELKDFKGEFNPPEHTLPSYGLGDIGWEDGLAQETEDFLVSIQTYLDDLDFGGNVPEGIIFVQKWLYKQMEPIMEKTEEYRTTTRRYYNGLMRNLQSEREENTKTTNHKDKKPQSYVTDTKQNIKEVKLQGEESSKDNLRNQVFICYSHKDERWLVDLQTHLKPYMRNGLTAWSDKQIVAGSKWLPEIEIALASAKVAVMLVSPNFLASDFIHEKELGPLLKKAEKDKVKIIWLPIRACSYKETPLKDYQAAIDPEKPLANMKAERDRAWVKICEEIKKVVLEK